jgi:hypothetical protein
MFRILLLIIVNNILIFSQTGGLTGKVTEGGTPIPGVNILIMNTTTGGITNDEGFYRIAKIPVGNHTIRFSAVGYKTQFINVTIVDGRSLELNIEMKTEAIEVDQIEIIDRRIQSQDDPTTSLIDLKPEGARILPGAVTDVFRTLQALPGVLAPNDFSSQLIIRGSGPDQNLIIMDDVEVFNPYRLYGVISMFNPESLIDINLITGGFPVQYGDRLSAVLDVTNRQGNITKSITGTLNASIVSANLVLEGKNPLDIPGSWLVSSRRTYYDLIIEPFVKNAGLVEDNVTFPNFYDVQAKIAFGPFSGNKFFINGIISRDAVDLVSSDDRETPDSVAVIDDSDNDLLSFAWHYAPKTNVLNKLIVSWYRNGGRTNFDSKLLDPSLNRNDFADAAPDTLSQYLVGFGFNSDFTFQKYSIDDKFLYYWGKDNEFSAGAGVDFMKTLVKFDFNLDPQLRAFFNSNPNIRAVFDDIGDEIKYSRYRAWAQNKFAFGDKIIFQPGLRFDYYDILEKGYLAPRVSLAYAFNDLTTLRAAWGIYYQSPGYEKLRDGNKLLDFDKKFTTALQAEHSIHYVLSLERWLSSEWRAKVDGYYKKFDDLIVPKQVTGKIYETELIPGKNPALKSSWIDPIVVQGDSLTQIPVNNSFGKAYGLEFLVEKKNIVGVTKFDGWISYSLAWTERSEYGRTLPFNFDQRHTLNVVLNYEVNNWFDIGIRFQYGSGFPITEPVGIKPRITLVDTNGDFIPDSPEIATRGESEDVIFDTDFGGIENRYRSRKPAYHRLDVRFSAKADYWDLDWIFYLDVINVYNRANVVGYDYFVNDDLTLGREKNTMFPILPTLGFNVRF